jgi:homoserine dehydrogenase
MARQNVFVLGATGNVGSELVRQILVHDAPAAQLPPSGGGLEHANPTIIVGVANRSHCRIEPGGIFFDPDHIDEFKDIKFNSQINGAPRDEQDKFDRWKSFLREHLFCETASGRKSEAPTTSASLHRLLGDVRQQGLEGDAVFVDVTADSRVMPKLHRMVIDESDNKIVTANKFPLVGISSDEFRNLTAARSRYGLRCTLMAGAHAVSHLMELYDSDEHVVQIQGCFSGALGYICSELENGEKLFSEIVDTAMQNKYTEPDPLEDLSGMDVARKLVIAARCLGFNVDLSEMVEQGNIKGLIDVEKYESLPSDRLIDALAQQEDDRIKEMYDHKCVRYVATLKTYDGRCDQPSTFKVKPKVVGTDSNLASLKGSANMIIIQSDKFPKGMEYVIQSPGAGVGVTASGIRRDLLALLPERKGGSYSI